MALTRRAFLGTSMAGVGLAVCGRAAARGLSGEFGGWASGHSEASYFEWKKVADGCHVATGEGGNALAVVAKGETFVIDAKNGGFGAALRREAEALGQPVKTLINTHHHFDHTGGNPAFTKDLTVVAHANLPPRIGSHVNRSIQAAQGAIAKLKQSQNAAAPKVIADVEAFLKSNPTEKDFMPNKLMPSSGTITLGGVSVELYHVGAGHTDNDLIVFIPEHNVVHGGDLLFHRMWPYVDPTNSGADTAGWITSCRKIIELCNEKTVVVPGHGEVGDVSIAQRQIDFFTKMREIAAREVEKGTTREEFLKLSPEEFKDFGLAEMIKPATLGGLWDEASKAKGK